jgi:Leucine-rich repeat (LRR) protein
MLKELECSDNQFSAAALNALFDMLHNNNISDINVRIDNNPGTEDMNIPERQSPQRSQMTMTTLAGEVKIYLAGTGTATINWGDGSECETHKLIPFEKKKRDKLHHAYSDESVHTITITGEKITWLNCGENQLTKLDVSQNTALTKLWCYRNQLTTLDVSKNTALIQLWCYSNQLTVLDVSKNAVLKELECGGNPLSVLDVSLNTALSKLDCWNNQLTALDMSRNTALKVLECNENQFSAAALNALFKTLHDNTVSDCEVHIHENPGTVDCNTGIAIGKGWKVIKKLTYEILDKCFREQDRLIAEGKMEKPKIIDDEFDDEDWAAVERGRTLEMVINEIEEKYGK